MTRAIGFNSFGERGGYRILARGGGDAVRVHRNSRDLVCVGTPRALFLIL